MKKIVILVLLLLLLPILIFSGSEKDAAMSLYFSGKDAYNSGKYYDAQRHFQNALIKNPDIEAKAPNIKYMLGVSAFNNNDYKTANTYLTLFSDNPIAKDLLSKIEQYEDTLPDEFLYHTTMHEENTTNASMTAIVNASNTSDEKESNGISPVILLVAITVLMISTAVFLEIKINTFSKLALKLVGVTPEFLNNQKEKHENTNSDQSESKEEKEVELTVDINDKVLLDTPFDEEINIDEMASKDITELTKFFGDSEPIFEKDSSDEINSDSHNISNDSKIEEFEDARSSILNSVLEEEDTNELSASDIEKGKKDSPAYKPKYEHLDNTPDDFDVNATISIAYELIEKAEKEAPAEKNNENWTPIGELSESLDEQEKFSINHFQNMDDLNEKNLDKYYDFIFEKHNKKAS
jgi:hypothetical protein